MVDKVKCETTHKWSQWTVNKSFWLYTTFIIEGELLSWQYWFNLQQCGSWGTLRDLLEACLATYSCWRLTVKCPFWNKSYSTQLFICQLQQKLWMISSINESPNVQRQWVKLPSCSLQTSVWVRRCICMCLCCSLHKINYRGRQHIHLSNWSLLHEDWWLSWAACKNVAPRHNLGCAWVLFLNVSWHLKYILWARIDSLPLTLYPVTWHIKGTDSGANPMPSHVGLAHSLCSQAAKGIGLLCI